MTSDADADDALALSATLAACIPEWRGAPIQHSREALVRQRLFQIACGYEDQNDATTLRHDPLLKAVCGRLPESGTPLASQPTLCRLEQANGRHACRRLAHVLLDCSLAACGQEGTAYHGYYVQHGWLPEFCVRQTGGGRRIPRATDGLVLACKSGAARRWSGAPLPGGVLACLSAH